MYIRNNEPSIEDLLSDEVTRLVMARDGFSDHMVRALVRDVQRRLHARHKAPEEPPSECAA
ncbi:MAG TPA: hypothetical protein VEI03_13530 [Stellaceae bacterium]|nr:hypothetical protein [Stellaceae bacterium]